MSLDEKMRLFKELGDPKVGPPKDVSNLFFWACV